MKFLSKIEILVKDRSFNKKRKFLSKIEFFCQRSKFFVKDRNCLSKIEIFVKNGSFYKILSHFLQCEPKWPILCRLAISQIIIENFTEKNNDKNFGSGK